MNGAWGLAVAAMAVLGAIFAASALPRRDSNSSDVETQEPIPDRPFVLPNEFHDEFEATLEPSISSSNWWATFPFPVERADLVESIEVTAVLIEPRDSRQELILRLIDSGAREIGRADSPNPLHIKVADVIPAGNYTVGVWVRPPSIETLFLTVTVDVTYSTRRLGEWPANVQRGFGEVKARSDDWRFDLLLPLPADRANISLQWNRSLPSDNLELQLRNRGEVIDSVIGVESEVGSSSVILTTGPLAGCCYEVVVVGASELAEPLIFQVTIVFEYSSSTD